MSTGITYYVIHNNFTYQTMPNSSSAVIFWYTLFRYIFNIIAFPSDSLMIIKLTRATYGQSDMDQIKWTKSNRMSRSKYIAYQ